MTYSYIGEVDSEVETLAPAGFGAHVRSAAHFAPETEHIARIVKKDESALVELRQRFHGILFSVCCRIVRNDSDAEEVVAETFWVAWNRAKDFNPKLGSVSTWLITIARNRAIDKLRSGARRQMEMSMDEFFEPASPFLGPDEISIQRQRAQAVRSAMAQLPAKQRQAIELAYFRGMTHCEIADYVEIPLGTAKTQVRQGLTNLRSIFGA